MAPASQGLGRSGPARSDTRRAKRLLVVDDEPTLVDILVERFTEAHYQVEAAGNRVDALMAIVRERPDAVLLDIRVDPRHHDHR